MLAIFCVDFNRCFDFEERRSRTCLFHLFNIIPVDRVILRVGHLFNIILVDRVILRVIEPDVSICAHLVSSKFNVTFLTLLRVKLLHI